MESLRSITHLQRMVNICHEVLGACDLKLNSTKCVCLRIGPRFKITDCKVCIEDQPLLWKSEFRHLGVFIISGKKFKCNLQNAKQKFYRAANGVLGKIGVSNHNLILSLIDTFCMPVLVYGLEALDLSKSDRNTIDFVYSSIFFKIFGVKETTVIRQCQFYSDCFPTSYRLDRKVFNFLNGIKLHKNSLQLLLFTWFGSDELSRIEANYSLLSSDHSWIVNFKLWHCFKMETLDS